MLKLTKLSQPSLHNCWIYFLFMFRPFIYFKNTMVYKGQRSIGIWASPLPLGGSVPLPVTTLYIWGLKSYSVAHYSGLLESPCILRFSFTIILMPLFIFIHGIWLTLKTWELSEDRIRTWHQHSSPVQVNDLMVGVRNSLLQSQSCHFFSNTLRNCREISSGLFSFLIISSFEIVKDT